MAATRIRAETIAETGRKCNNPRMTSDDARREIEALHVFFVRWYRGEYDDAAQALQAELAARLGPDFRYILPSGTLLDRPAVLSGIGSGFGTNPEFEIDIADVRVVHEQGEFVLAEYLEHQRGAVNTKPPENTRRSTVLLQRAAEAPTGFRWLHLQETAVPPQA